MGQTGSFPNAAQNLVRKLDVDYRITSFLPKYGVFAVSAANALYFHSPIIGVASLVASCIIAGAAICSVFMKNKTLTFNDYLFGILLYLAALSFIIAPFMILSNFNETSFAVLMLAAGIPVSMMRLSFGVSGKPIKMRFSLYLLPLVVLGILLISDIALMAQARTDSFGWIWPTKIPHEHVWLIFAIAIIAFSFVLVFRNKDTVKSIIIMMYSFAVLYYIAIVVGTLPGSDNWVMIGEINSHMFVEKELDVILANRTDVGPFSIPTALVLGLARGFANGLAVFLTIGSQISIYSIFPWITPILFGVFGTAMAQRIGRVISSDHRLGIVMAASLLLLPIILFREASTTKLSLSFIFFLVQVFLWLKYLKNPSRVNLLYAAVSTAAGLLSYPLFFIVALQIGIAALCFRIPYHRYEAVRRTRLPLMAAAAGILVLMVPAVDLLLDTRIRSDLTLPYIRESMYQWIFDFSGVNGFPNASKSGIFPQTALFLADTGWFLASTILWILTIIGIVRRGAMNKNVHSLILWIFVSSSISFFIASYAMEGVRPLALYLTIIMELSRIPLIALAIIFLIDNGSKLIARVIHNVRGLSVATAGIACVIALLMAFVVLSSLTIEYRFSNVTQGDVDAADFVTRTNEKYAVITSLTQVSVIYAYSNGQVEGGGFLLDYGPGTSNKVRSGEFLSAVLQSDSVTDVMYEAAEESDTCKIYLIVTPILGLSDTAIKRLEDNLGQPLSFGKEGKTRLFSFTAC